MTDFFTLLDEPHRPWLEPEELKQKFLMLSAMVHPDRAHNLGEAEREKAQQHYTAMNAAYHCLREPKDRLRHLLELERGAAAKDIQQIPPELMNVFMEIGQACRETDSFLAEKNTVSSPLLKVQFFERGQERAEKLSHLQKQVNNRRESLVTELKAVDMEWMAAVPAGRNSLLVRLENLGRLFSYFDRWQAQIQERITQLSF